MQLRVQVPLVRLVMRCREVELAAVILARSRADHAELQVQAAWLEVAFRVSGIRD